MDSSLSKVYVDEGDPFIENRCEKFEGQLAFKLMRNDQRDHAVGQSIQILCVNIKHGVVL